MTAELWTTAAETCIVSGAMAPAEPERDEVTQGDIRQMLFEV